MTVIRLAAVLAALTAGTASADDAGPSRPDNGLAQAESIAATMDADGDGGITAEEALSFAGPVFASIDADSSGGVSRAEMREWEFGMADLAAFRGRTQAYETAIAITFDAFDADRDGSIDEAEHSAGVARSVAQADADGDGAMSRAEFLDRFVYSVAMRNALEDRP